MRPEAQEIIQSLDLLAERIRDLGPMSDDEFENIGGSVMGLANSWRYSPAQAEEAA